MGLDVKPNPELNGLAAFSKLGDCSAEFLNVLKETGAKIVLTGSGLQISHPTTGKEFFLKIAPASIGMLHKKTMSIAEKSSLYSEAFEMVCDVVPDHWKAKLVIENNKQSSNKVVSGVVAKPVSGGVSALAALASQMPEGPTSPEQAAELIQKAHAEFGNTPTVKKAMGKLWGVKAEPAAHGGSMEAYAPLTPDEIEMLPMMKLRDAKHLYQPVHGTSNGKGYYCVAAGPVLNVAAKYVGQALSIRIEGQQFASYKHRIEAAGIHSVNADYASIHLSVDDDMAMKTVGAIILGLGVPMLTPLPNLELIRDKVG